MTKLFSLKSLAFAGTAAVALALASAPQADAEEAAAAKPGIRLNPGMSEGYIAEVGTTTDPEAGELTDDPNVYILHTTGAGIDVNVNTANLIVSKSAVDVVDGKVLLYYSSVGHGKTPKQWTQIAVSYTDEHGWYDEMDEEYYLTVPIAEWTKGKAADVYIAADADAEMQAGPVECKAAPKLKAALRVDDVVTGPSLLLKNGSTELTKGTYEITGQYSGDSYGGYYYHYTGYAATLAKGTDKLSAFLSQVADLNGATLMITYHSDDLMVPDATAKLKVPSSKAAPKVSLKLSNAFSMKIKNTMEYRIYAVGEEEPEGWTKGTNTALTAETFFGKDHVTKAAVGTDTPLVSNMLFQLRTAAKGKKTASQIASRTIYASSPAPTTANAIINNNVETKKDKTTTGATITFHTEGLELTQNSATTSGSAVSGSAVATLQYSTDGTKWTDVKTGKNTVTYKSGKIPANLYVRVKGVNYAAANKKKDTKAKYDEAAGYIMAVKLDAENPEENSEYTFRGITATAGGIVKK